MMRKAVPLLVALALIRGLLYAAIIPPWQAPDEIAHFESSHLLARYRRPTGYADMSPALERDIIQSLYRYQAWRYIPRETPGDVPDRLVDTPFFGRSRTVIRFSAAYVPYALAVTPFLDRSVEIQLYVMRLVSVIIGTVMLLVVLKIAALVEPKNPALAIGAALIVLFLPQHTFLMATVGDGNLAELFASLTLYQLARMVKAGLTWPRIGLAVIYGLIAILSKATAYFLVPLAMVVGLAFLLRRLRAARAETRVRGTVMPPILRAVLVGAVLMVPVVPLVVLTVLSSPLRNALITVVDNLAQPAAIGPRFVEMVASGALGQGLITTYRSYWMTFGWMSLPLPPHWYWLIGGACALAGLGWARRFRARRAGTPTFFMYAFLGVAAAMPAVVLLGWFSLSSVGLAAVQGRYLHGGLIPLAVLLARGWLTLVAPQRSRAVLAVIAVSGVVLDTAALVLLAVPYYYR
jgi:hypothetical protein